MRYLFPLLFLLVSLNLFAATGFENGNHFIENTYSGKVHVICNDRRSGRRTAYFSCRGYELSPETHSYFVSDEAPDANRVTLKAFHEDGSVKTKSSAFDGAKSNKRFNLWVISIFQKPLLEYGVNRIEYFLNQPNDASVFGHFDVIVDRGENIRCRTRTYWSSLNSDCTSSSRMCDRYFRDNNCN